MKSERMNEDDNTQNLNDSSQTNTESDIKPAPNSGIAGDIQLSNDEARKQFLEDREKQDSDIEARRQESHNEIDANKWNGAQPVVDKMFKPLNNESENSERAQAATDGEKLKVPPPPDRYSPRDKDGNLVPPPPPPRKKDGDKGDDKDEGKEGLKDKVGVSDESLMKNAGKIGSQIGSGNTGGTGALGKATAAKAGLNMAGKALSGDKEAAEQLAEGMVVEGGSQALGVATEAAVASTGVGALVAGLVKKIVTWLSRKVLPHILNLQKKMRKYMFWILLVNFIFLFLIISSGVAIATQASKGIFGKTTTLSSDPGSDIDAAQIQALIAQNPGGFIFPAVGKDKGDICSPWGVDRGSYHHRGIDISLPIGTPYVASATGTIVYLKDDIADSAEGVDLWHNGQGRNQNGGFGNAIAVQVNEGPWQGFIYEIHHLKQGSATGAGLKEGDIVQQGQFIGRSGHNGISTGPHIHYQVDIPSMIGAKRTSSKCEVAVVNGHSPCGEGTTGNRYSNDTINPIIPLGWGK